MALHTVFGAGPIGVSLARHLIAEGRQVRIVSRRGTEVEGALAIRADASHPAEALKAANGAETVYNCTNVPYVEWESSLPPLFRSILSAAEKCRARLVLLDNLYTYYPVEGPISETSKEDPPGHKGRLRLKLAGEHLRAHDDGKVEVAIARASDFYGPDMTNVHLGERVFAPLAEGRSVQWIGNPDQPHAFAYREDVARALAILGTARDQMGKVWIVPHAPAITPRQMIEIAGKILGHGPKIQCLNRGMLGTLGLFVPMLREIKETYYQFDRPFTVDSSAFEHAFGQTPTPLEAGLRKTLAAMRKQEPATQ